MAMDKETISKLPANPMRGLNYVIDNIEKTWFGGDIQINSGSHPVVFCSDLTIGTAYGWLNALSDAISEVFPEHARNIAELSRNMNTEQRYGLFGMPSSGLVSFIISVNNLIEYSPQAVKSDGTSLPYSMLLIPKDTVFDVNGYQFSIDNGIEIRYNEKTGIQTVYDPDTNNPFNLLQSNVLKREVKSIRGTNYLIIEIPVRQLSVDPKENITSTVASGARGTINYTDFLYGIRAFITRNGVKSELDVTYDSSVFDNKLPTLAIDLDTTNKVFRYSIPDIYIENQLGVGNLSIYTYTTKGPLDKDFRDTDLRDYAPVYRDFRYGIRDLNKYSAPLETMGGIAWKFASTITGGTSPASFDDIKYDVVTGKRVQRSVITDNNLQGTIKAYGYSSVKTIDDVTELLYGLTKELPLQENKGFYSSLGCYIGSNLVSIADLIISGVALDNGERITIPSGVMFNITGPVATLVNRLSIDSLNLMTNEQLISHFEVESYIYLPYHYVFDVNDDQIGLRSYYLDNPTIGIQSFKEENGTLGLEVGLNAASIVHDANGYVIRVQTISGQSFMDLNDRDIGIQLSLPVAGSEQLANVKGVLEYKTVGGERVYVFRLDSRFDIDAIDNLYFNGMSRFGSIQQSTPIVMTNALKFIVMRSSSQWQQDLLADSYIDRSLYTSPMIAVMYTEFDVVFGKKLAYLYSRVRPLVGSGQYKTYEFDVPKLYDNDVFEYVNGELVLPPVLLHRKGEQEYTSDGTPVILHQKGDWVKDENGNFVPVAPRRLLFHWDFLGFDGNYRYSKDPYDIEYAQSIKDYLVDSASKDMELFTQALLNQSRMLFQPRNKLGYGSVIINNNYESTIKLDLTFEITYYLTGSGMTNSNLQATLKEQTPRIINNILFGKSTISNSEMIANINAILPGEVSSFKLQMFAGGSIIDVVSNENDLSGFSIRKHLELGDNKLPMVKEDVKVDFLPHYVNRL